MGGLNKAILLFCYKNSLCFVFPHRDHKTMDNKLIYITNYDKQLPHCRFKSLVEKIWLSKD